MNDVEQSSPPPRKEDVLFQNDLPDWQNNACLNVGRDNDRTAYTEGYRRGARLLVEYVVDRARDQDYLVYPVIFLYRHHIELALKNIIMQALYLLGRKLSSTEKTHLEQHRLDLLWADLKPILKGLCETARWKPLDSEDVEGIDNHIRQLSELDPDSYRFRYTHSKKGDPSLPPEVKQINLRHFAELIEHLVDYLGGMDTALYSLLDFKAEMEAEYRREMADYLGYA
jgi:hypothetical protein